jgi:hypothetical protein
MNTEMNTITPKTGRRNRPNNTGDAKKEIIVDLT